MDRIEGKLAPGPIQIELASELKIRESSGGKRRNGTRHEGET
jgi:hypothetical protein